MSDDGSQKDDVKLPDGDVGEKIEKLFRTEEKDTSKFFIYIFLFFTIQLRKLLTFLFPYLDVTIMTAMGEEVAVDAKEAPKL